MSFLLTVGCRIPLRRNRGTSPPNGHFVDFVTFGYDESERARVAIGDNASEARQHALETLLSPLTRHDNKLEMNMSQSNA